MRKLRIVFTHIILLLSITSLSGQNFKEFSNESEEFLNQLNSLFSNISLKENKDASERMMKKFTGFWNTGVFTKETKENIREICNLMLKRRLKPYPYYYYYLACVGGMMEMDQSAESYKAWNNSVIDLINDKRSTKPISSFLITTYNLLYENILYSSNATTWKSGSGNYTFMFDTVPVVVFDILNLTCYANKDSSIIYDTKGLFYPLTSTWIGKKGKVNWVRAGFGPDDVYAFLDNYQIYLGFSKYTADSVQFYHKKYWSKPLLGSFEEKVLANATEEKASYPRFHSYNVQIEIKNVFDDINFRGGIEMRGSKLIGTGNEENDAYLSFLKDKKEFVKIFSKNFVIYPDKIASSLASATVICEEDSIYHPGLQMSFNNENRELSLVRSGEGETKSPFYDSFHNLDIYSEAIYWKTDEPTINFQNIKGVSGIATANFESSNYFALGRFLKLQGIDPVNPLLIIKNYAEKYNVSEIPVQGLAEEIQMPQDQIIGMLVNLSNKGFVIYNRDKKSARIKDKLYDYIDASNRRIDYDVIQFNSETYHYQNASLELDSFGLKLFGVPLVHLSDSQNVLIYPTNQQLIVKKGMDFAFSGRVHAGTFDFYTRGCEFNYDQFKFDMPVIDSLSMMVTSFETNENGDRYLVKVKNVISDLGGDLLIDDPNNKSGLKNFPTYPIFTSTKDAYVYYDNPSIFNGVYKRDKFYFYLYPFTIDSLDNFKTELLEFSGYLASAGIFPDWEDTLRVQRDYSLGFQSATGPEGIAAYGGKGTYFANFSLSNAGLRGKGSLEYLTSTSNSDDYMFFPDSLNTLAKDFVINEQFTPVEFPAVQAMDVWQHWKPHEDMMIIYQRTAPFRMFNSQSNLQGMLVLTPNILSGAGKMAFEDAAMTSKLYTFKQHEIFADSADFTLTSNVYHQSAFSTSNYKSHIDFNERNGQFVSNGGASSVEFPVNKYICMIDEFKWFMDSYQIAIGSTEKETEMAQYDNLPINELIDVPLKGSEFISIHPDQDSLSFISTIATYNLKDFTLNAEDVKYIRVADAAIFPGDKTVIIKPDAKMNTLANAKILANTVSRYHEIYDAVVDIKSKNNYIGIGDYDYVDEKGNKQKIFLKNIGVDPTYQTVGDGSVSDTTGFKISNDFDFTGRIFLSANNQFLNFDGGFMIHEVCNPGRQNWVKFKSDINPQDIYINIDTNLTNIKKEPIESSLMFSNENNSFYSAFLSQKRAPSDQQIISANGFIRFDKASEVFNIAEMNKLKGNTIQGNEVSLDRRKCILNAEGKINLGAELGMLKMRTYGSVKHFIIPDSVSFDLIMTMDFAFDEKSLELMADKMNSKNLKGINLTRPVYLKALTDIMGEKSAEKTIADIKLMGKFRRYPDELQHTLMFSEVKFKWNEASRSFVSYGPIGIGSIGKSQVNKYVDGFIEIERKRTGDVVNIYLEFDNGNEWYFFNFRNNLMQSISSNTDYNNIIRDLKEDKRTVKGGKGEEDYKFIISDLRKKTDFLRRMGK